MKINRGVFAPLLAILGLLSVYFITLKPVFLYREGQLLRVLTHASSVAVVLREAGMTWQSGAQPVPGLEAPVGWGMTIEIPAEGAIPVFARGGVSHVSFPADESVFLRTLLSRAGIELTEEEWVFCDGVALPPDSLLDTAPETIEVRTAVEFVVSEDGRAETYRAPGPTVGEALWQAGFTVFAADQVVPPASTRLDAVGQSPIVIELIRSRPITVRVDGKTVDTRAAGKTVGEALARAGFALTGLDYSIPAEGVPLPPDGEIRIVRVREEILREQTQIPFELETRPDETLELDRTRIIQAGAHGILESTVRVRFEDGVEVSRIPEGQHVLLAPQSRIVGYGTQVVVRTAETADGTIEYYRAITVYATSYSPCRLGVDPPRCNNITHSGKILQKGMIAMVYRWYVLFQGHPVYVEGYGPATVEDSGVGPNAPYWIDLAYLDDEYVAWHRYTTLYFLTPVPANVPWILP
ncbi:MAG: G5 domain-containing protein [Anaerolineales bacterium]|nr:G5 domain-containing protein [Anaerolineales bacterium]